MVVGVGIFCIDSFCQVAWGDIKYFNRYLGSFF